MLVCSFLFVRSQIDYDNPSVRERILETAVKRASKWMALREEATPLIGQVGGRGRNKKPVLTLAADYILKPLVTDPRGLREIAFYEAIETVTQQHNANSLTQNNTTVHTYAALFLGGQEGKKTGPIARTWEMIDTFSLAFAMLLGYRFVQDQQEELREAWKAIKREMDSIHRLAKFVPRYYGVVGQSGVSSEHPFGVNEDAYIMFQSVTGIFSQPCVIDLKMGTHTYEPDAPSEKIARESGKYPMQQEFGFRIVGMRFYDPTHKQADEKGYRTFDKEYGRSLTTKESVVDALRTFFSGGDPTALSEEMEINGKNDMPPLVLSSSRVRLKAISDVHLNLRSLRRWFEENRSLQFVASSLLIVYEGDPLKGNGDVTTLKLIDFGHARRNFGGDPGYTHGLRTLTHMLGDIVQEEKDRIQQ